MNLFTRTTVAAVIALTPSFVHADETGDSAYASGMVQRLTNACRDPYQFPTTCTQRTMQETLNFSRAYKENLNENPNLQDAQASLQRGIAVQTLQTYCEGTLRGDYSFPSTAHAHNYAVQSVTQCLRAIYNIVTEFSAPHNGFKESFDAQTWNTLSNHFECFRKIANCAGTPTLAPRN